MISSMGVWSAPGLQYDQRPYGCRTDLEFRDRVQQWLAKGEFSFAFSGGSRMD